MDVHEYKDKIDDLFQRWNAARPEYSLPGKRFTLDGVIDYQKWTMARPRILFLLKENHADENEWEPRDGITVYSNLFSLNIARWRQVLTELYNDPAKELSYSEMELPGGIDDIALVEVKKVNERKGTSDYDDILSYAEIDGAFLREQIEIINPDIIFCCNTIDAFGDYIFDEPWDEAIISISKCACLKLGNRLVIDFFHPSTRSTEWAEELFVILCQMIKEGTVYRKFTWN